MRDEDLTQKQLFQAQLPVVAALEKVGFRIDSVWEHESRKELPEPVIEVIVEHLHKSYPFHVQWALGDMLCMGKPAKKWWPTLFKLFVDDPDITGFKRKITIGHALGSMLDRETLPQIIALLRDTRHGESRGGLLAALWQSRQPERVAVLESMIRDPSLAPEVEHLLKTAAARAAKKKRCLNGHTFVKTSSCPTCPKCEAARKPQFGFLAELAAPARRALEGAGLTTLSKLAKKSEAQVLELHGMGPNAMSKLRASLKKDGLSFAKG